LKKYVEMSVARRLT